jgi:hypothetical protein
VGEAERAIENRRLVEAGLVRVVRRMRRERG